MWNPFKKSNNQSDDSNISDDDKKEDNVAEAELPKMNMLQRIAMKKLERMSPKEREKMMQDMFKPENKDKILQAMEMMKKTGQITEAQYEEAKKKMGL